MTGDAPNPSRLWLAKVAAEIQWAESLLSDPRRVASSPPAYSAAMVVKGRPSPEDEAEGRAFAGQDGEAIRKALAALGVAGEPFLTVARPSAKADKDLQGVAKRLRGLAEAVEAELVVALDGVAAEDIARAFGLSGLRPGEPAEMPGFRLLATDDFAAALADERAKRIVWRQLKSLLKG